MLDVLVVAPHAAICIDLAGLGTYAELVSHSGDRPQFSAEFGERVGESVPAPVNPSTAGGRHGGDDDCTATAAADYRGNSVVHAVTSR